MGPEKRPPTEILNIIASFWRTVLNGKIVERAIFRTKLRIQQKSSDDVTDAANAVLTAAEFSF